MKNLLVFAIAFVWLFSLSTTAFAEAEKVTDTVILKSGRTIKGIVLSEKWDFVTGSRRIPTVTVQRIIHHDTPPDYKEALDLIEKKQYDNAVFKLKLANDAPRVRDWLKLYVDYQMAEIDWRQGNWDEARKKYREIDKKYKDHIFSRTTVWRIAQSLLYGGDYQNAEGAFEVIFKDNRFHIKMAQTLLLKPMKIHKGRVGVYGYSNHIRYSGSFWSCNCFNLYGWRAVPFYKYPLSYDCGWRNTWSNNDKLSH